jgi:hypothetical protein
MEENRSHELLPLALALEITPECVAVGWTEEILTKLLRMNLLSGVLDSVTGQAFTSRAALLRLLAMREWELGNQR